MLEMLTIGEPEEPPMDCEHAVSFMHGSSARLPPGIWRGLETSSLRGDEQTLVNAQWPIALCMVWHWP